MNILFSLIVLFLGQVAFATTQQQPGFIPAMQELDASAYILMDAYSGRIFVEKNADSRLPPASLTKVMTLYIVADALAANKLKLTDTTVVSEEAWRTGGSRMFIQVGTTVSIQDLISGIATASGNDATVAIAEHLSGTEQNFVGLMNQMAKRLGMVNTNFTSCDGQLSSTQYSSAKDLATLSRAWILNFPQYYPWFKEKWMMYNGIKQPNRNHLLWHDPSVDGFKTGHNSNESGYCLIASAQRNGMRLISVVLGAKNDATRTKYSEALLNYGFRFFETKKVLSANTNLIAPRVKYGKDKFVQLGLKNDLYITLPVNQLGRLKAKADVAKALVAPIAKGQTCGTINVTLDGKIIASQPLVALKDDARANFILTLFDYFR